jgi:hypothetical protein
MASFPDEPRQSELRLSAGRDVPQGDTPPRLLEDPVAPVIAIEAPAGAAVSLLADSLEAVLPSPVTLSDGQTYLVARTHRLEITWTVPAPGRIGLPLRPPSAMALRESILGCRSSWRETSNGTSRRSSENSQV